MAEQKRRSYFLRASSPMVWFFAKLPQNNPIPKTICGPHIDELVEGRMPPRWIYFDLRIINFLSSTQSTSMKLVRNLVSFLI